MDNRQARTLACISRSRLVCNAFCYTTGMTQLVVRITDDMARSIDALVEEGTVGSRSEAVREALDALIERHRRARVGAEIVNGYRELPQVDDGSWPDAATVAMIADEPW